VLKHDTAQVLQAGVVPKSAALQRLLGPSASPFLLCRLHPSPEVVSHVLAIYCHLLVSPSTAGEAWKAAREELEARIRELGGGAAAERAKIIVCFYVFLLRRLVAQQPSLLSQV
jgi:hypothetical protein